MIYVGLLLYGVSRSEIPSLEAEAAKRPTAAIYHALAFDYVWSGDYGRAATAFETAATKYQTLGDSNAAIVLRTQAARYRTDLQVFVEVPNDGTSINTGRRLEPPCGCLTGVNIEREDGTRDPEEFDSSIGKPQGMFFIYSKYGMPFPKQYAEQVKKINAGLQIAWEPSNLDEVQDNGYLHEFARDAVKSGIPIYLRFASEMNGDWTPYHNDPAAYVQKFQLVATVMHAETSNVATVWCPNEIPQSSIDSYFPGDNAVDWVGVNFYSVVYNDGNRDRVATWKNPSDSLDYVYQKYTAKHPMMIGEWGASHQSVVDEVDRTDFAVDKIGQLYAALPRLYPRVKAVNWLSMNTEKYAEGDRRLNDFCLLDDDAVASAYTKATECGYYLSSATSTPPTKIVPLAPDAVLKGQVKLSAVVRSYDQHPHVTYTLGGSRTYDAGSETGPYEVQVDSTGFANGPLQVVITATDSHGVVAGTKTISVKVQN
ncbi:MAG TPA: glycosyl hydrolase [Fimbriimonas sp.]|nr:glycosyl hydrolase [Fimbriimonas sp.]